MNRPWILIALLALLLRAAAVLALHEPVPTGDALSYHDLARSLVVSHRFAMDGLPTAYRLPAYPIFLAAVYHFIGINPWAAAIAQALLGMGVVLLMMGITRMLGGTPKAQSLAGLITAVYPFFIYYTARLLTETWVVFWITWAWWLYLQWRQYPHRQRWPLLWGLTVGILMLTKSTFVPWAGLVLAGTWADSRLRRQAGFFTSWMIAALALCFLPAGWALRNHHALGRPVLDTHGGMTCVECMVYYDINKAGRFSDYFKTEPLYLETNTLGEVERDRVLMNRYRQFLREEPGRFLRQALANIKDFWRLYPRQDLTFSLSTRWLTAISLLTEPFLLAVGIWGFWSRRQDWAQWQPAWSAIALLTLAHAVSCAQMRYRLPLMPFFIAATSLRLGART